MKHTFESTEELQREFLIWRGIDPGNECKDCGGTGVKTYPDTTMGRGGIGGQTITSGRCNNCGGSGDVTYKWK